MRGKRLGGKIVAYSCRGVMISYYLRRKDARCNSPSRTLSYRCHNYREKPSRCPSCKSLYETYRRLRTVSYTKNNVIVITMISFQGEFENKRKRRRKFFSRIPCSRDRRTIRPYTPRARSYSFAYSRISFQARTWSPLLSSKRPPRKWRKILFEFVCPYHI